MLVHYLSRLGATIAVLAAELPCGDGVSTKWALERAKTSHHCDGVMSHSFKCSRLSRYDFELKLPSQLFVRNQTHSQPHLTKKDSMNPRKQSQQTAIHLVIVERKCQSKHTVDRLNPQPA